MYSRVLKSASRIALLALVALVPVALTAQDAAKPVAKKAATDDSISRWDIFAGYSYLAPIGTVNVLQGNYTTVAPYTFNSINTGAVVSAARYFNKHVGLELDYAMHPESNTINDGFYNITGGVVWRFPSDEITPFVHVLAGADRVNGPFFQVQSYNWGPSIGVGGGMDYATPYFNHHLAIRLFQYDYSYTHVNFGEGVFGGRANPKLNQISTGVVYHIGGLKPPPQVTLTCKATPDKTNPVFPGDPVTIAATANFLNPKLTTTYSWSGTGVSGGGATVTANTANLAPGVYSVKAHVTQGIKPWMSADCAPVEYAVRDYDPPTITCSASPSSVIEPGTSTITSRASSPQNRPLTISYSVTNGVGSVSGSGNSATFNAPEGTPVGTANITCSVVDDKGHSASASTSVDVTIPKAPEIKHTSNLCSITFGKKTQPVDRVDNEAKGCLDEVALSLQKDPEAKLVVIGEEDAKERGPMAKGKNAKVNNKDAAQRAVNTKAYLVEDKQIDPSRISVFTDMDDAQIAKSVLIPLGAQGPYTGAGTTPVDETKVKPQSRTRAQAHAAAEAASKNKKPATKKKAAAPAAK